MSIYQKHVITLIFDKKSELTKPLIDYNSNIATLKNKYNATN